MQASAARLPVFTAEAGLSKYLAEIRRFPLLEPHEEYALAKRWRERGDRAAGVRLVTSHLRLVARIASGYRGYGLPIGEVIAEGSVGLMQAVKRFDPTKGFRLTTYAIWWIKAAIQEYILRSWSMVKIGASANQRRLFFKLRTAKSRISAFEEGDLQPDHVEQIAQQLQVPAQDVVEMNRRLGGDVSLNVAVGEDGGAGEWQDWLVDEAPSPERTLAQSQECDGRRSALAAALEVLAPGRERRIFAARRLADEPVTLEALAEEFAISRERVRQIEARAFAKVQKAVKSPLAARAPRPRAARGDTRPLALASCWLRRAGAGPGIRRDLWRIGWIDSSACGRSFRSSTAAALRPPRRCSRRRPPASPTTSRRSRTISASSCSIARRESCTSPRSGGISTSTARRS